MFLQGLSRNFCQDLEYFLGLLQSLGVLIVLLNKKIDTFFESSALGHFLLTFEINNAVERFLSWIGDSWLAGGRGAGDCFSVFSAFCSIF